MEEVNLLKQELVDAHKVHDDAKKSKQKQIKEINQEIKDMAKKMEELSL